MNRITMHTNTVEIGNQQLFEEFLEETTSDFIYLLHYHETYVKKALERGKRVVIRLFDPFNDYNKGMETFDNQFHRLHTADETIRWLNNTSLTKYKNNPNVYFIVGYNEPQLDDLVSQFNWFIRFGQLAIASGFNVCLGGWNTAKSIRVNSDGSCPDIDNGVWDSLLLFAHENRKHIILDFHCYTTGRAWANQISGFPDALLDRNKMNARPKDLIWNSKNVKGQWHIGRIAPLVYRARSKSYSVRFGDGECVWDTLADIQETIKKICASYCMPEFNEIKGIVSLYRYYKFLSGKENYTDINFCEDAMKDMIWMDEQYPPEFEYFAIFAYNRNIYWRTCDLSVPRMKHFIELIMKYERNIMVTYPDKQTLNYVGAEIFPTGDYANVRENPTTTASLAGKLELNIDNAFIADSQPYIDPSNGLHWYAVDFDTETSIVNGWIREDVFDYNIHESPEEQVIDFALTVTKGDRQKAIQFVEAMVVLIQQINPEYAYDIVIKSTESDYVDLNLLANSPTIVLNESQKLYIGNALRKLAQYIEQD